MDIYTDEDAPIAGHWQFGIGKYDHKNSNEEDDWDFRAEFRPQKKVMINNVRPWAGGEITNEGTVFAGGGLLYDWMFMPHYYVTPSFGVGFHSDGINLNNIEFDLKFRSQIELSYEFDNADRFGIAYSRLSNSDLEDSDKVTNLYYQLAF